MTGRRATARAFTLLEVLVATALVAVLAGSLYASLSIAFRARRSALAATDPVRKAQLAVELLGEDLRCAVVPSGVFAGPFVGQDGQDDRGHDSDALMLYTTTSSPEPAEGVGDVKYVELGCEPSDDGKTQVLVRLITTNLRPPRAVEPVREVLCRGVFALNLRYFSGSQWADNWDSTTEDNTLPCAVEVTLQLDDARQGDPPWRGDAVASPAVGGYRVSKVFLVPCGVIVSGAVQVTGSSP